MSPAGPRVAGCTTRHQRVGWQSNGIRAMSYATAGSLGVTLCVTMCPRIPLFEQELR